MIAGSGGMRIGDIQLTNNAQTRGSWAAFSDHRRRVTAALRGLARDRRARLGVFGAGNCNDLDLKGLRASFSRIDLIDLDARALAFAVRNQAVLGEEGIFLHGNVDLTGVAAHLSQWRPETPASPDSVAECMAVVRGTPGIAARFDVMASVGVLSQLIDGLISTLGQEHPQFEELMTTIRRRHLRLLLDATRPGGAAFLGLDVVSSLTCPQLLTVAEQDLPQLVTAAVRGRNFFTGMNPFVLFDTLRTDPQLAPLVKTVTAGKPWLWNLGNRCYAVVPFVILRNEREALAADVRRCQAQIPPIAGRRNG